MNLGSKIKKSIILETIKWSSVVLLSILLIIGDHVYHDSNIYLKSLVICAFLLCIVSILISTKLGRLMVVFGKESCLELQKIVWPTYQDSLNTTLVVVIVTIIISLILWGLDTVLVHIISFGLRF